MHSFSHTWITTINKTLFFNKFHSPLCKFGLLELLGTLFSNVCQEYVFLVLFCFCCFSNFRMIFFSPQTCVDSVGATICTFPVVIQLNVLYIPSLVRVRRPCRGLEKFFPPVLQRCYGCSFHAQEIVYTGHGMLGYYCFFFVFFLERKVPAQSKLKRVTLHWMCLLQCPIILFFGEAKFSFYKFQLEGGNAVIFHARHEMTWKQNKQSQKAFRRQNVQYSRKICLRLTVFVLNQVRVFVSGAYRRTQHAQTLLFTQKK